MGYVNVCRFTAASSGTGSFVVSAAVTGYQTPASAAAKDGMTYFYRAESTDLSQWEVGYGVYTVSTTTLTRATVLFNSSGGSSAINFSAAPQVAIVALAEGLREVLIANRIYYVRTDGSDSNSGLANTAGGAFLTIQKAVDVVAALDCSTYQITIQVGTGTYTGAVSLKPCIGALPPILKGDTTTPSNCLISTTSFIAVSVSAFSSWRLQGFKITTTTSGQGISVSGQGALLIDGSMDYGSTVSAHISVGRGGYVNITSSYSITGAATQHISCGTGGFCIVEGSITVTITGTPAFSSSFVGASGTALLRATGTTYSGSATGTRYAVSSNGVIETGGGGASFFPGDVAGTTATGGQYT